MQPVQRVSPIMVRALLVLAAVLAGRPALAGDCSTGGPDVVASLEAYARGRTKTAPTPNHLCVEQGVIGDAKLTKRFLAACETIVARDVKDMTCIGWSVELGAKKLGALDLFDGVTANFTLDAFQYQNQATRLLRKLDDPRAVPIVRAQWVKANADKRASQSKHAHDFTVYRHAAIALMASHGGADDAAFLAEQAKTIKDKGLKRAIAKAITAIEKRPK
jgi:hypothetical protein